MSNAKILLLPVLLTIAACASHYSLSGIKYGRIEVTSEFDDSPDSISMHIVEPYQNVVDSLMSPVLGVSEMVMRPARPESLLSNFVADVLMKAAFQLGIKADMALCNVGGLRSSMPKGEVTYGDVLEIAPFENRLCIVTLGGDKMMELMRQIAAVGGEGISGVSLQITKTGDLIEAKVGGRTINEDKKYIVATLDYLAEGNDKMYALKDCLEKQNTELSVRALIMDAIQREHAAGRKVTARMEGRIVIK